MPLLLPGTNGVMAIKVSKYTGYPVCYSQLYKHPDGEKYFRFAAEVEGEDIIIFNSMHPNPDEIILETLFMIETALDLGANSVSCVFPYFAYSRTLDRRIRGESVPLKTISRILRNSGIKKIYVVDYHLPENLDIFGVKVENLTAMHILSRYCIENFSENFTIIAPDENARNWAEEFRKEVDAKIITLRKIRIDAENVIIESQPLRIDGDVIIVDDIIATGATVCQAVKIAKKAGCKRVFAACTHAILSCDALMRVLEAGVDDLTATDTIPGPISHVSVAKLIADSLKSDFG